MDKKIVCFHNPDENNGYLSNWYLSGFKADGVNKWTYPEIQPHLVRMYNKWIKDNQK